MRLIVLTGLVIVEKQQLAADLARHYHRLDERVFVLDNDVGVSSTDGVQVQPLKDLSQLAATLGEKVEVAILAVHPGTSPEDLFASLDTLAANLPDLEIRTLALIDTRTCDCFPHLREELERYADVVLRVPFSLEDAFTL